MQSSWQWLVPPAVGDGAGGLIPRKQLLLFASAPDSGETSLAHQEQELELEQDSVRPPEPEVSPVWPSHPDANQMARLDGVPVAYLLQRSRRRSIGFAVRAEGLIVTAPQWVGMREIEQALQSKAGWLTRKLGEAGQRQLSRQAACIDWAHGGRLDFLGQAMTLELSGNEEGMLGARHARREQSADGSQSLCLPLGKQAPAVQVRAAVQAWMLREARNHFTARLQHHAPLMGVQWRALRLTSARTRWGSANTDGVIRLNWRLMQHGTDVIDYVVVHELAHLRHMDHSPRFWAVVADVLPHWKQLRQVLKDKPLPAWE
ncbi:SprT family zinc-dependent metalloprotease [Comamonas sp. w2-DMI]|uniref:M48 family metallopeptidase n=1 Tax=Comamonas sp. w2-DMI TaxID=3126391 RepID=UPI0032E47B64